MKLCNDRKPESLSTDQTLTLDVYVFLSATLSLNRLEAVFVFAYNLSIRKKEKFINLHASTSHISRLNAHGYIYVDT